MKQLTQQVKQRVCSVYSLVYIHDALLSVAAARGRVGHWRLTWKRRVCVPETDRQRRRQRQTNRYIQTEDKHIHVYTDRDRQKQIDRDRQTDRDRETETNRQTIVSFCLHLKPSR